MKVKSESEVTQSCSTLSDPMDCSPPGFSVHGIFQARVLEWGAIAFSEKKKKEIIPRNSDFFFYLPLWFPGTSASIPAVYSCRYREGSGLARLYPMKE